MIATIAPQARMSGKRRFVMTGITEATSSS
jgi:hypothetical protein